MDPVSSASIHVAVHLPGGGQSPGGNTARAGAGTAAGSPGVSRGELRSALDSGRKVANVADEVGVSPETLNASMTEKVAETVPNRTAEQLTDDQLDAVLVGIRPPPPPPPQRVAIDSPLSELAQALNSSTDELLGEIESGDLAALFDRAGIVPWPGMLVDVRV